MSVAFDRIVDALDRGGLLRRESGGQRTGICPAHDDRKASLCVRDFGDNAGVYCHAGCSAVDVMGKLDLPLAALFDSYWSRNGNGRGPLAVYSYTDEDGRPLFEVVRLDGKEFPVRLPGAERWGIGDTRRVLYRLPRVVEAASRGGTVYVAEGEKDVHAIEGAGAVATCNPFGAGKWRDEYAEALRGAHVVVIADRDEAGRKHARDVVKSVSPVAASVALYEPKAGKDASDHFAAGGSLSEFVEVNLSVVTASRVEPVAADEDAASLCDALTKALRLDRAGLSIVGAEMHGRGPGAVVAMHLSNRTTIEVDRFDALLSTSRLSALVIATSGVPVMFKGAECADIAARIVRLAEHHAEIDATDLAREWGTAFLGAASTLDVDIDDQAGRWEAFFRLSEMDPIAVARHSQRSIAAESVVLDDKTQRLRYVHSGWFLAHVRRDVGPIGGAELINRMSRVGWRRAGSPGSRGRLKATNPGPTRGVRLLPFYVVKLGWEDADDDVR